MATVDGNITIRVGSEDYQDIQLLEYDGVTPIDLTGATKAVMKLMDMDGNTKKFATDDASPKLFFDADLTTGKLQLRQEGDDFTTEIVWKYYVEIWDGIGLHPVPEGKEYFFTVNADIPD